MSKDIMEALMANPESIKRIPKDKALSSILNKMATSPTPEVRIRVLECLSVLGPTKTGAQIVLDMIREPEEKVRLQLAQTFKKVGDQALEPLMLQLYAEEKVRPQIQDLITKIGYEEMADCVNGVRVTNPDEALYYEIILRIYHPDLTTWNYTSYDPKLNYSAQPEKIVTVLGNSLGAKDQLIRKNALLACESYPQVGKYLEKQVVDATKAPDPELVKIALNTLATLKVPSTVPTLAKLLPDNNNLVRMDAARLLGQVQTDEAVAPLIKQLEKEKDAEVKQAIEMALGKIGEPAAAPLVEKLRKDENRDSVEVALKRIGPPAVKYLADAMTDSNTTIRANATRLSVLIYTTAYGFGGTVKKLIDLLKDKSADVREAVIESIINMGQPAIEFCIETCSEPDPILRKSSIEVIDRFSIMNVELVLEEFRTKQPARTAELARVLAVYHTNPDLKDKCFLMLENLSQDTKVEWEAISFKLREFHLASMKERDPNVRFGAAQVARFFGHSVIPDLQELLKDKEAEVRESAADSLGFLGEAAAVAIPDIVKLLKTKDSQVKITIFNALASIGVPDVVPYLIEGMGDPDEEVRNTAIECIKTVGNTAFDALVQSLSDKNEFIRASAVGMLLEAGKEGVDIFSYVVQHMDNPDSQFQASATRIFQEYKEQACPILMNGLKNTTNTLSQSFIIKNLALLHHDPAIGDIIESIRYGDKQLYQAAADAVQIYGDEALNRFTELFGFNDPQTLKNIEEISKLIEPDKLIIRLIKQLSKTSEPGTTSVRNVLKKFEKEAEVILLQLKQSDPAEALTISNILVADPKLRKLGEKIAKA